MHYEKYCIVVREKIDRLITRFGTEIMPFLQALMFFRGGVFKLAVPGVQWHRRGRGALHRRQFLEPPGGLAVPEGPKGRLDREGNCPLDVAGGTKLEKREAEMRYRRKTFSLRDPTDTSMYLFVHKPFFSVLIHVYIVGYVCCY